MKKIFILLILLPLIIFDVAAIVNIPEKKRIGSENPNVILTKKYLSPPFKSIIKTGNVSGTWMKKSSPYLIKGEITIPDGETLIIDPGVEVIFEGHYKFNVKGRLLAIATFKDTITFTAKDYETGWHGIRFEDTPITNDSSKIIYCKLECGKGNSGIQVRDKWGGAICATINKLRISHCLFRNNMTYHPNIDESGGGAIALGGSPIIENCEFFNNQSTFGSALLIWRSNINPLIRNNFFHHNSGNGTINIGSWGDEKTSPIFINTIIYGNKPTQVRLEMASELHFFNCLIEGGRDKFSGQNFSGTYQNIFEEDPQFADEANFNFHLRDGSPCIGSGLDSVEVKGIWYYARRIDFKGNSRPSESFPDIGAVVSKSSENSNK